MRQSGEKIFSGPSNTTISQETTVSVLKIRAFQLLATGGDDRKVNAAHNVKIPQCSYTGSDPHRLR